MDHGLLPPEFLASLLALRAELDAVDAQFVSLLAARFAITDRIGALKATHGVAAADPAREQAQLERLSSLSSDLGLPSQVTCAVYEILFQFVRANHLARAELATPSPRVERLGPSD